MASFVDYITQGSRIFYTGWKRRISPKKYEGNADEICRQIVNDCWNGSFFQTSTGNFSQFWTRDFGWCTASLIELGFTQEIHKTLRYALNRFKESKKITTTLTPSGKPFDFPTFAVDSLPWLIHSIKISNFPYYSYKAFLNTQVRKYIEEVLDSHTGLVKPDSHFSSMKDFSIRRSACYDNCMVGMLAKDLADMKHLANPLHKFNYPELIERHFWSGDFFYDDLKKKEYIAGDANVFPFVLGLIGDRKKIKLVVQSLEEEGLADPFPLKYTKDKKEIDFIWEEVFLKDYESNAIWMHMGPLFVKLVKEIDQEKAEKYKITYGKLIEKYGNYLEVFDKNGKPFSTPFYYCDSGMLWAANYLNL